MRTSRVRRLLLVLGALVLLTGPWLAATHLGALWGTPAPAPKRPKSIVWAGRVFSNRASLAAWLTAHGQSYSRWARLHPYDSAIIERRPLPTASAPAAASRSVVTSAAEATQSVQQDSRPAAAASPRGPERWLNIVLLSVGAMAMLAAFVPSALLDRGGARLGGVHRTYVFAAGAALCIGVLVGLRG